MRGEKRNTRAVRPRTLVHCCCEEGNLLNRPYLKDSPVKYVDFTQSDDFTTEKGYHNTIAGIKGARGYLVLLLAMYRRVSMECFQRQDRPVAWVDYGVEQYCRACEVTLEVVG